MLLGILSDHALHMVFLCKAQCSIDSALVGGILIDIG